MDIVITYVNGLDPEWQKDYERYTNTPILEKRFRDWGTLKYLFRGIAKNMPFIRKVHLIVSQESQVPEWIDRNQVNIVLHKDIIPAEYLPTFNCNPIEMHLHRIEGLDEEYLYFNDDIFPLKPCKATDFFRNGRGVLGMSYHLFVADMFKRICHNSNKVARKALGLKQSLFFLRPQHVCTPMLKSECAELYSKVEPEIRESISRVRAGNNLNQYLFLDYMYLKGKIIRERLSKKHFSVGIVSANKLRQFIEKPTHTLTCVNDVQLSEERYNELRETLLSAFERALPEKSKFEK
ncbi:MAG: hypothetical protein IIW52_01670 [Alistipes sp.]|nr:hypothetical protein [Alistipes sp.]